MNLKSASLTGTRLILGTVFFVMGLNGFFHFLPEPAMPAEAQAMISTLGDTGYFFPMLKTVEILTGIMLLTNVFIPLALVLLAPVLVNIFMFHLFLAPQGLPLAIFLGLLELFLAFGYRAYYQDMLEADAIADLDANHISAMMF